MNTQGMTTQKNEEDNPLTKPNINPYEYPVKDVPSRRVFSDVEREELKDIIKESLLDFWCRRNIWHKFL